VLIRPRHVKRSHRPRSSCREPGSVLPRSRFVSFTGCNTVILPTEAWDLSAGKPRNGELSLPKRSEKGRRIGGSGE
jgi:hypothetical protein